MSHGAAPIVFPPSGFPADGESVSKCRGRLRGTVACPERGEDTLNFTSSDGLARSQSGHCPQGQNFFQKIVRALVMALVLKIEMAIAPAKRRPGAGAFAGTKPRLGRSRARPGSIEGDWKRLVAKCVCPIRWWRQVRETWPSGNPLAQTAGRFPFTLKTWPCLKFRNVIDPLIRSSWMMRRPSVRCGPARGSTLRSLALKATGLAHAQSRICRGKFMARQC